MVPIKAIILNLLAVGAAYGLLVAVFQKGWGNGIFGFQQVEVIEAWIPLFLFSVLFGLSMDYEVFLLSRIREHYDKTKDKIHRLPISERREQLYFELGRLDEKLYGYAMKPRLNPPQRTQASKS